MIYYARYGQLWISVRARTDKRSRQPLQKCSPTPEITSLGQLLAVACMRRRLPLLQPIKQVLSELPTYTPGMPDACRAADSQSLVVGCRLILDGNTTASRVACRGDRTVAS